MKDMAKHVTTVISDFWVSKFAQYTYYKISPLVQNRPIQYSTEQCCRVQYNNTQYLFNTLNVKLETLNTALKKKYCIHGLMDQ